MNIYETIDFLKTKLEENQNEPSDLMHGYNIEVDIEKDLSKLVPVILIEAERTEFFNPNEYGTPTMQDHVLSLTVFESAQKIEFEDYKSRVNITVKKLIDKLMTIDDYRINKLRPTEMAHNEFEIDSLKTSAVVVGLKVRTYWQE